MTDVPAPALTVVTLGVGDVSRSAAFYQALGLRRRFAAAGDGVAFFEAGGTVLALYGADNLASDAGLQAAPAPPGFRGLTLAWNCNSPAEVDAVMAHAAAKGATIVKPAHATHYGGYCGYFADPDGHLWEAVQAPGITVGPDRRVSLPE